MSPMGGQMVMFRDKAMTGIVWKHKSHLKDKKDYKRIPNIHTKPINQIISFHTNWHKFITWSEDGTIKLQDVDIDDGMKNTQKKPLCSQFGFSVKQTKLHL